MKKCLSFVLSLVFICTFFLTGCNKSEVANLASDFEYHENSDGGITITKYIGSDTEVVIPQKIENKDVTVLGTQSFAYCDSLVSVSMPDTITTIENFAFWRLAALKSVELSSNLKVIKGAAFENCINLTNITLPASLTEINAAAFKGCQSLKYINIPKSIKIWDQDTFVDSGLENIDFEDGLELIGETAFVNTKISKINIPKSVKTIEFGAFSGCKNLEFVTLNEGLTTIENFAFGGQSKIFEIVIPSTVTVINEDSFEQCMSLQSVKFQGDAPDNYMHQEGMREYMLYSDYIVYYHNNAKGFTSPEWNGYKTALW